jgi:predicted ATP-grasp superfamily ATP-dependent carboligase
VGASARAAAYSAVRAGFSVRTADLFADVDLVRLCPAIRVDDYPAGLATVLAAQHSGKWLYTGALENHPSLLDECERLRPLLGNSGTVVRRVRDPFVVADIFRQAGLQTPAVGHDPDALDRDLAWLSKPLASAGGLHVQAWNPSDAAGPGECYFQQAITGTPCSAVYVAARGRAVLLGMTGQLVGVPWTGAVGYQYCGSIGPLDASAEVSEQFAAIGSVLARQCDLVGLFGVDTIVNAAGVWPVEVNPRFTASIEILERAYRFSAIALHVAACEKGDLPPNDRPPVREWHGKAILFANAPFGVSQAISDLAEEAARNAWPVVADIPQPGSRIEAGWPILTVFATAADDRAVLAKLEALGDSIRTLAGGRPSARR